MDFVDFDDCSVKDYKTAVCTSYAQPIKKAPAEKYISMGAFLWALTDSNRRPSACKADALNQLS